MASTLQLAAGDARVAVVPAAGGSIAEFTWRGAEVLKSAAPQAVAAGRRPRDGELSAGSLLEPDRRRPARVRRSVTCAPAQPRRPPARDPRRRLAAALGGARARRRAGRRSMLHAADGSGAQDWPWPFRAEQEFRLAATRWRRIAHRDAGDREHRPRGASPAGSAGTRSSRATRRPGSRSPPPASGRPTPRGCPTACVRRGALGLRDPAPGPRRAAGPCLRRLVRSARSCSRAPAAVAIGSVPTRRAVPRRLRARRRPDFDRPRAGHAHDRRVQPRRARRRRHGDADARARRAHFPVRCASHAAASAADDRMTARSPFTCVLDVQASLGECPVWSAPRASLYWVDINAPSLNRFDPATGRNTAMPMPESIGCFALRRGGGFVVALRDGIWLARRATARSTRKVADAPYDPAHHRFNDGRCDPQGRFLVGTMNERRDARLGGAVCASTPTSRCHARARRHDDQQRPRLQPRRPHDVPRRHADARRPRLRLRRRDGHAVAAARVRALAPARPTVPTAAPSTATAATGPRSTAAARCCGSRRRGETLAEYPGAGDVPDDVRVRRPRPQDALRDHARGSSATPTSSRGCRSPAASSRCASTCRACPSPRSPADPHRDSPCMLRLHRLPPPRRAAAASAPRRRRVVRDVDRRHPRGVAATGPACSGCASARTRGPTTASSSGAPRRARSRGARRRAGRSPPATRRSRSPAAPLRFRLLQRARRSLGVDHRRALPRLDAAAGVRPRARRAASGPRRSRSRRASRCTASARSSARSTSAASSSTRRSRTRSASTPGLAYKNAPFAWSPGTGRGAWGVFVHTPAMVTHGVGHPDWSHRSYALVVDDEALDLFLFAADTPAGHPRRSTRSSPAARRRCRAGASGLWVSRAYYKTPEEAIAVAREAARARGFPATCSRSTAARRGRSRRASTSSGIPSASPIRARRSRAIKAHAPPRLRLGIPVRVGPRAAVRRARVARLPAERRRRRSATCSRWDTAPGDRAPSATC